MLDFKGIDNFYLILLFIVPGVIALSVRSKLITGRPPSTTENLLTFLVLSLVYYSFTIFFIEAAFNVREPWVARATIWICLLLVGPAIFGFVLGVAAQKEWFSSLLEHVIRAAANYRWTSWIANKLDLSVIHVIPAAWDWRFSKISRSGSFIMVTFVSGEVVAGYFGSESFASSDTGERDLYIEEEYTISAEGKWESRTEKVGILIPVKEIKHIEFWQP
jgi:hypothetical protein